MSESSNTTGPGITPAERTALRALCEAATEGPWTAYSRHHKNQWGIDSPTIQRVAELNGKETSANLRVGDDARLIAAARNALPALLTALDAAEARAERAEEFAKKAVQDASANLTCLLAEKRQEIERAEAAESALAALRAEAEGLRARLDESEAEAQRWRDRANKMDAMIGGCTYVEDAERDIAIYRSNRAQAWSGAHCKRNVIVGTLTWGAAWAAAEGRREEGGGVAMHTKTFHTKHFGEVVVNYNSDFSGMARVAFDDLSRPQLERRRVVELPAEALVVMSHDVALRKAISALEDLL